MTPPGSINVPEIPGLEQVRYYVKAATAAIAARPINTNEKRLSSSSE